MTDYAYTRYSITSHGDDYVSLITETNDNRDTGYPGEFAAWTDEFKGPGALKKVKKITGVSRQGVGHRVFVTLDGEEI